MPAGIVARDLAHSCDTVELATRQQPRRHRAHREDTMGSAPATWSGGQALNHHDILRDRRPLDAVHRRQTHVQHWTSNSTRRSVVHFDRTRRQHVVELGVKHKGCSQRICSTGGTILLLLRENNLSWGWARADQIWVEPVPPHHRGRIELRIAKMQWGYPSDRSRVPTTNHISLLRLPFLIWRIAVEMRVVIHELL